MSYLMEKLNNQHKDTTDIWSNIQVGIVAWNENVAGHCNKYFKQERRFQNYTRGVLNT
jgi:hypothetical protein